MNRAALAAAAALLGGGLWLYLRDSQAATLDRAPAPSIADQIESTLEDAMNAIRPSWTLPAAGEPYRIALSEAEDRYSIVRNLLARQLDIESDHFNPAVIDGTRRSRAGAIGIAQFMPATAVELKIDPTNPFASIDAAGKYMRQLYARFGDWRQALAAYNWGQGNQAKDLRDGIVGNEWPAETRSYVEKIAGVILV